MEEKEFQFEEFKMIVGTGRDYFGFYFRAVILYFAVLGLLLKLFVDSGIGSTERLVIFFIGLGVNIGALVGTLAAEPKYKAIAERCDNLAGQLGVPNVYFPGTILTAKAFLLGIAVIGIAWLFLYLII